MEDTNIGERIALLRKSRGLTQKQMAEKLNVSDKAVSRWERSESAPDLSLIPIIADLFGISCDDLLRGKNTTGPEKSRENAPVPTSAPANFRIYTVISCWLLALGMMACVMCYLGLGYRYAVLGFGLELAFCIGAAMCMTVGILKAPDDIHIKKESTATVGIWMLCLLSGSALTLNSSLDWEEVLLLGIPLGSFVLMAGLLLKWFRIVPTDNIKLQELRITIARGITYAVIITLTVCPLVCIGFSGELTYILYLIFFPLEILLALLIYRHDKKEL